MARQVGRQLNATRSSSFEDERIRLVKGLIALLPESAPRLTRLVRSTGPRDAELRFTLFCYLDEVPRLRNAKEFAKSVPVLIEEHLMNVATDTGLAAWMAGHLLGDHWSLSSALPVLLKVANEARFVAGRESAIHGLFDALARAGVSEGQRIREALKAVAHSDRSGRVRTAALETAERRITDATMD